MKKRVKRKQSKGWWSWWKILLIILFALGFLFDKPITQFIVSNRISILNNIFILLGGGIIYILVVIISTGLFVLKQEKRKYIPVLWLSIVLSYVITLILKNIVGRARPEFSALITPISQFSFPSGHTVIAFSVLAILQKGFKKISKIWFVAAIIIAFTRVYLGVHYLSDVLAGALLGYFVSLISLELEDNYKFSNKLLNIFKTKKRKR